MGDDAGIGRIDQHMQRLPHRRRQEFQPEIMAGGGEDEEHDQREDAERLEGEAADLAEAGVGGEERLEIGRRREGEIPVDDEACMGERDEGGQHAEMAAIIKQRQEAPVEPGERADSEDHAQHQEGAGAEGAGIVDVGRNRLREVEGSGNVAREQQQIGRRAGDQHRIVEPLIIVPLDRRVFDAHPRFSPGWSMRMGVTLAGHVWRTAIAPMTISGMSMPKTSQSRLWDLRSGR